ncbi:hypothetical protein [Streptomyces sp. MZ04]|uniref:hypothetical protein n=1 Tax=Streptomyces sp. MZ04 TaxID=2559236 RepID=UPI00107ED46D|nr:hypothetical protein [Streptomyces sp. MZ04]TGB11517.1 hypothetical protein E2651_13155 [Streptomyces sp. MZ04]
MQQQGRTVKVSVRLRGAAWQKDELERRFTAKGWILISCPREEDFPLDDQDDHAGTYVLGVIVRPGPERWDGREAIREVEGLADAGGFDLTVRHIQPGPRQREVLPKWYGYVPARIDSGRGRRWANTLARKWGVYDTGEILVGPLPLVHGHDVNSRVRAPYGGDEAAHNSRLRLRVGVQRRIQTWLVVSLFGACLCGGWAAAATSWWQAVAASLVALGFGAALFGLLRRSEASASFPAIVLVSLLACGALVVVGMIAGLGTVALVCGVVPVSHGVRLLAQTGARRPLLIAAGVALLPVVLPWSLNMGAVQYTFYGAAFGVAPEHMQVAQVHKAVASLSVLAVSGSLVMGFLAAWGYAVYYLRGMADRYLSPLLALIAVAALGLAWLVTVPQGPGEAGRKAVADWHRNRVPATYEGVTALPVCVTPLRPVAELPAYAQDVDPFKVYAAFGVVDGEIWLWDPDTENDFSVPADSLRALKAGTGKAGDRIPRSCTGK